jgi:predicted peroxiredoxin
MSKILVHITHGPEAPTRVALGFLVAKTAVEEGHEVSVFLAGDAVQFARESVAAATIGVGTGSVAEHAAALKGSGTKFYLSKMSCGARGVTEADAASLGAEMATPQMLVKFSLEHDRMFTY